MSAKLPFTLTTNRPGEITLACFDQFNDAPDGDNKFRISLHTPKGAVNFVLSNKDGFYVEGANGFRVNGATVIQLLSELCEIKGNIVNISGTSTTITAEEQIHMGSDDTLVTSAGKSWLAFGKDMLLSAIQSVAASAITVTVKAMQLIDIQSRLTIISGKIIHGKLPKPVARVGDSVFVPTPQGPVIGRIISGSSEVGVS